MITSPSLIVLWLSLTDNIESKKACKYIVSVLFLAASEDCESALGRFICQGIAQQQLPSLARCREHFSHVPDQYPVTQTLQNNLNDYDDIIGLVVEHD